MSREEKIKAIIAILVEYESDLSDGYDFYVGIPDWADQALMEKLVNEKLAEIAGKILDTIDEQRNTP